MKIDVSEITRYDGASLDISVEEVLDDITSSGEAILFDEPVSFNGKLVNNNGVLRLDGRMEAVYKVNCYRCLKDISKNMDTAIREDFLKADGTAVDEAYTYQDGFIDLGKVLKDNIILNMPMKQLCESNCKGLCPVCGANLNDGACSCPKNEEINPGMEILKNFFKD